MEGTSPRVKTGKDKPPWGWRGLHAAGQPGHSSSSCSPAPSTHGGGRDPYPVLASSAGHQATEIIRGKGTLALLTFLPTASRPGRASLVCMATVSLSGLQDLRTCRNHQSLPPTDTSLLKLSRKTFQNGGPGWHGEGVRKD